MCSPLKKPPKSEEEEPRLLSLLTKGWGVGLWGRGAWGAGGGGGGGGREGHGEGDGFLAAIFACPGIAASAGLYAA